MESIKILYVTCKDTNEAREIGKDLIREKLAACINILPEMESLYMWEGKLESANEAILIVKTRASIVPQCSERIKSRHSYKTPCILVLGIERGNPDYIKWLVDQTLPD